MQRLTLTLVAGLTVGLAQASPQEPKPLFGDWYYLMPDGWRDANWPRDSDPCQTVPEYPHDGRDYYLPVNQPGAGHGGPTYEPGAWMAWYAVCLAEQFEDIGAPVSLMIRNRNCPFPYATEGLEVEPDALPQALDALPRLDYLIMDLETWGSDGTQMLQVNVSEIVRQVRSHPNPKVANAYIGNYGDFPNAIDEAQIWPTKRNRRAYSSSGAEPWDRSALYHDLFNVAMPPAYPAEVYSRHSDRPIQGDNVTPNDRYAIFWAPIERVSASARELPEGHALIPWLTPYSSSTADPRFYHAPPPSWEDLESLVHHIRLRGATSYMIWTPTQTVTDHPDFDYPTFREMTIESWGMLDPIFEASREVEFLNLATNKRDAVLWSAVRAGHEIWVLASNLDETQTRTVSLPMIGGLPAETPPIPPGEHVLLTYQCNAGVRDFNLDGTVNDDDFYAFIMSIRDPNVAWPNTVGGRGADWRDTDGNGLLDLRDVLNVAMSYWRSEFRDFADARRAGGG